MFSIRTNFGFLVCFWQKWHISHPIKQEWQFRCNSKINVSKCAIIGSPKCANFGTKTYLEKKASLSEIEALSKPIAQEERNGPPNANQGLSVNPPPPVTLFLLMQNVSFKDIAGKGIVKLKVPYCQMGIKG